jgi:pilus assembly protein CpaB
VNRRKVLAALAALLLAVISTGVLIKYVQGAEDRALAGEELVEVLVAKENISAGTSAADLASSVVAQRVPAKVRAADAVVTFSEIAGLVAAIDVVPGEQLLARRFVNPVNFQGARSASAAVPKNADEVTFKLAPERALGGQLRPGDKVTVVASFESEDDLSGDPTGSGPTGKLPDISHVLLNQAIVVRVQFPEDANTSTKEKNGVAVAPTQEMLVTLAVDQPSLERAVFASEFGKVWLSYEPKDADSTQNQLVTRENIYTATKSLLDDPLVTSGQPDEVVPASVVPTTLAGK